MNINCIDPLGRSALLIAIENDNIEMILLLLRFDIQLNDALLHAINEDNVEATQILLAYELEHRKDPSVRLTLIVCVPLTLSLAILCVYIYLFILCTISFYVKLHQRGA